MKRINCFLACLILVATTATAQNKRPQFAKLEPPPPMTAIAGQPLDIELRLDVNSGFHINAEKPTYDYQIPTKLDWTSKEFKHVSTEFPKPEKTSFSFAPNDKLDVYQGMVTIKSRFDVPKSAAAGKVTLEGKLRYQACDDKACYPPATIPVEVPVEVKRKAK